MKRFLLAVFLALAALPALAQSSNKSGVLYASAVRSATSSGQDMQNTGYSCLTVIFDITAVPTTDTVTLTIQGNDPASGKYYTILAGSAEAGVATKTYKVCPGITASANVSVSDILPAVWRVTMTHSAATNFTYSVGYNVNY